MNGKQLKNSILQLAIQGNLVPQDPNDEPASVLLQRIRKEKERLVKEGKLKKKDLLSETIIDEEKPFEIPESWEWCRIGDIFSHNNGKQLNRADTQGELHDYITTSNLYWDRFELKEVRQMLFTEEELVRCTATKGDLLVCEGGDVGRSAIWNYEYDICIQNHIHRVRAYLPLCTRYFLYLLMFNKSIGLIGGKGIGIQGFSAKALHNTIVALPPLAEQHRIVEKIEQVMPFVEEYDKAQTKLDELNCKLPEALKKSILQEAIQGKLVPQDPNDEPASVLLQRIRKEKERLVKEGKLKKKDLISEPITDEEKPFEIPESWEWVRLGDISKNITKGTTPRGGNVSYSSSGIGFLRAENVAGYDKLDLSSMKYVTIEEHKGFLSRSIIEADDILITIAGTLGRTALVNKKHLPLNSNQAISIVRLVNVKLMDLKYLINALNEPNIQKILTKQKKVTAIPNLTLEIIRDCLIPLPPLAEQHRIVAKIEELFAISFNESI